MGKLPFVVEPRLPSIIEEIGSDESGKIQIERKGYLTVGERAFSQSSMEGVDVHGTVFSLVKKIAAGLKCTKEEAHASVTRLITDAPSCDLDEKVQENYEEDLTTILSLLVESQKRKELVQAYTLLLYRVDPTIQVSDVLGQHPDLISGLSKLFEEEEARSIKKLEEAMPAKNEPEVKEEAEKK